jgi:hypothetical protein
MFQHQYLLERFRENSAVEKFLGYSDDWPQCLRNFYFIFLFDIALIKKINFVSDIQEFLKIIYFQFPI